MIPRFKSEIRGVQKITLTVRWIKMAILSLLLMSKLKEPLIQTKLEHIQSRTHMTVSQKQLISK